MMKKKLFYLVGLCFFILGMPENGSARFLSEDIVAKMNEIKEYNKQQEKNKKYIQTHEEEPLQLEEVKDDKYWDLAFHAKFADYGDKESQYIIAKAYEEGTYTGVNLKKAMAFYKKAAENGHLEASMKLGRVYLEEKWVQKDEEKALYYYLKATQQEYAPAQMKVAELYEQKGDYEKAYHYMELALKQLFPNEKNLIARSPDLERLSNKIKESQVIETDDSYDFNDNKVF